MRKLVPLVALVLPLAACATSPYGYGYGADPISAVIGALGSSSTYGSPYGYGNYGYSNYGYGGSSAFSQAAANACASYASRYGRVSISSVRQESSSRMHVYGYVNRGYGADNWDCTFRSDGRVTDFDI